MKYSKNGYKKNSKDKNNPYNVIPSGDITMEGVDFPVYGIDNLGNEQIMMPGAHYTFPGNTVLEVPLRRGALQNYTNKAWTPSGLQFPSSESTHVMGREYIPGRGWVAFPTIFQNSIPYEDEELNWIDMRNEHWEDAFREAEKRGEVIDFGEDEEAAIQFADEGNWKKQQGGEESNMHPFEQWATSQGMNPQEALQMIMDDPEGYPPEVIEAAQSYQEELKQLNTVNDKQDEEIYKVPEFQGDDGSSEVNESDVTTQETKESPDFTGTTQGEEKETNPPNPFDDPEFKKDYLNKIKNWNQNAPDDYYDPNIVIHDTPGRAYYEPYYETINLYQGDGDDILSHELHHHMQNINDELTYHGMMKKYFPNDVGLHFDTHVPKPKGPVTHQVLGNYYDRRGLEKNMLMNSFIKSNPDSKFFPAFQEVVYDRLEDDQYDVPWTMEGEAYEIENQGGYPTNILNRLRKNANVYDYGGELDKYQGGGFGSLLRNIFKQTPKATDDIVRNVNEVIPPTLIDPAGPDIMGGPYMMEKSVQPGTGPLAKDALDAIGEVTEPLRIAKEEAKVIKQNNEKLNPLLQTIFSAEGRAASKVPLKGAKVTKEHLFKLAEEAQLFKPRRMNYKQRVIDQFWYFDQTSQQMKRRKGYGDKGFPGQTSRHSGEPTTLPKEGETFPNYLRRVDKDYAQYKPKFNEATGKFDHVTSHDGFADYIGYDHHAIERFMSTLRNLGHNVTGAEFKKMFPQRIYHGSTQKFDTPIINWSNPDMRPPGMTLDEFNKLKKTRNFKSNPPTFFGTLNPRYAESYSSRGPLNWDQNQSIELALRREHPLGLKASPKQYKSGTTGVLEDDIHSFKNRTMYSYSIPDDAVVHYDGNILNGSSYFNNNGTLTDKAQKLVDQGVDVVFGKSGHGTSEILHLTQKGISDFKPIPRLDRNKLHQSGYFQDADIYDVAQLEYDKILGNTPSHSPLISGRSEVIQNIPGGPAYQHFYGPTHGYNPSLDITKMNPEDFTMKGNQKFMKGPFDDGPGIEYYTPYTTPYFDEGGDLPKAQTGYGDIIQYNQAMDIDYDPVEDSSDGGVASQLLDLMSMPSNYMAEIAEGVLNVGDQTFDGKDAIPAFKGDWSFTNQYGEPMKFASDVTGVNTWAQKNMPFAKWLPGLAVDMFTDPTTYVGVGIISNMLKKGARKGITKALPKTADFVSDYGTSANIRARGPAINYDDIIDLNVRLANKNLIDPNNPIAYLHGTGSSSFPGIIDLGGLTSRGSLLDMGAIPMTGELGGLGTATRHVNDNAISVMNLLDRDVAINYAKGMGQPKNYVDDFVNFSELIRSGKLDWMSPHQQNLMKDLYRKRVHQFSESNILDQKLLSENYPMVFGINPKSNILGSNRFTIPTSMFSGEAGIKGITGLDEISNIFVPNNKIDLTKKYLGDRASNIQIKSLDDLEEFKKLGGSIISKEDLQKYQNAGEVDYTPQTQRQVKLQDLKDGEVNMEGLTPYVNYSIPYDIDFHETDVPDYIKLRQSIAESTLDPEAVSEKGATGLTQIMPITLKHYEERTGDTSIDLTNYQDAMKVQDWLMQDLYNADWINKPNQSDMVRMAKTLSAYNWGRTAFNEFINRQKDNKVDIYGDRMPWIQNLPKETRDYLSKILWDNHPQMTIDYKHVMDRPKKYGTYFDAYNFEYKKGGEKKKLQTLWKQFKKWRKGGNVSSVVLDELKDRKIIKSNKIKPETQKKFFKIDPKNLNISFADSYDLEKLIVKKVSRGGETSLTLNQQINFYNDYINSLYDNTPQFNKAKSLYDKINRLYVLDAKKKGGSILDYMKSLPKYQGDKGSSETKDIKKVYNTYYSDEEPINNEILFPVYESSTENNPIFHDNRNLGALIYYTPENKDSDTGFFTSDLERMTPYLNKTYGEGNWKSIQLPSQEYNPRYLELTELIENHPSTIKHRKERDKLRDENDLSLEPLFEQMDILQRKMNKSNDDNDDKEFKRLDAEMQKLQSELNKKDIEYSKRRREHDENYEKSLETEYPDLWEARYEYESDFKTGPNKFLPAKDIANKYFSDIKNLKSDGNIFIMQHGDSRIGPLTMAESYRNEDMRSPQIVDTFGEVLLPESKGGWLPDDNSVVCYGGMCSGDEQFKRITEASGVTTYAQPGTWSGYQPSFGNDILAQYFNTDEEGIINPNFDGGAYISHALNDGILESDTTGVILAPDIRRGIHADDMAFGEIEPFPEPPQRNNTIEDQMQMRAPARSMGQRGMRRELRPLPNRQIGGAISALRNLFKRTPKFASEIDWAKWNKAIPEDKVLMEEYHAIEEMTKRSGTWMKNLDGSDFVGSPEQFVQQQSQNFKNAYPDGFTEVWRGMDKENPLLLNEHMIKKGNTGVFAGDYNTAMGYATQYPVPGGPRNPLIYNLAMRNTDNSINIPGLGSDWGDIKNPWKSKENLQRRINWLQEDIDKIKSETKPPIIGSADDPLKYTKEYRINARRQQIKEVEDVLNNWDKTMGNPLYRNFAKAWRTADKDFAAGRGPGDFWFDQFGTTDNLAQYLQKNNLDNLSIKGIDDGGSFDWYFPIDGNIASTYINNQIPGNFLKSLQGNVGTFDLTNPNIYKQYGGDYGIHY